jgi:hypothetical protein
MLGSGQTATGSTTAPLTEMLPLSAYGDLTETR